MKNIKLMEVETRSSHPRTLPSKSLLLQQMLELSDSIAARTIYWLAALTTSRLLFTSLILQ